MILKKTAATCLKVLSQYLPTATDEERGTSEGKSVNQDLQKRNEVLILGTNTFNCSVCQRQG
jgi:hypothetical protein